ncbi:hypothetical protein ACKVMW_12355 [Vibrio chagasii]|uniref:hypothetical protein n=1 Tax=Vibrio chagasii TaxID=170679 RepID=UPI003D9FBB20
MLRKTLMATAVLATLAGCASPAVEVCTPDTRVEIEKSEVEIPSTEDIKVIVLSPSISFKDAAKTKLITSMRNELETQISTSGAELVDRSLANKLKKEIVFAEQSGRYNTKGASVADIAVITEITASDLTYKYKEEREREKDDGEVKHYPAECKFEVSVKAVTKVVAVPSMSLIKRIEMEGDEQITVEESDSECPITIGQYQSLASKAATEAVEHTYDLKQLLAASAPVSELRQCEHGSMVKLNMGTNKKVTPGAEVLFSKAMKSNEGDVEIFPIGKGHVVNNQHNAVTPKYSWVSIDEETAKRVEAGSLGKIVPEKCHWADLECILD